MKRVLKGHRNFLKAVIFLAVLILAFLPVRYILVQKKSWEKYDSFYAEKNDFDVFFTGLSHMEHDVFPMELWEDYGITSFNLGMYEAYLPVAYWALQNALRYTTPKLVVVDVRRIEKDDPEINMALASPTFDSMPLSDIKIRAVQDLMKGDSFEEKLEVLFPFIRYHSSWSELSPEDFAEIDSWPDKGTPHYSDGIYFAPEDTLVNPGKSHPGSEYMIDYLEKIIDLCRENQVEVMLIEQPFYANKKTIRYANGVEDLAEEYGVNYLNFFSDDYIDTIHYKTDQYDRQGHLNDSGGFRVTDVIGQYIKEHYDIPDRRTDEAYASWKDDYAQYREYMFQRIVDGKEKGLYYYLMLLSNNDVNVEIKIPEDSAVYSDEEAIALLRNLTYDCSMDPESMDTAIEKKQSYSLTLKRDTDEIVEKTGKKIKGMDKWETRPDLLVSVYDNATGEQIDQAAFKDRNMIRE